MRQSFEFRAILGLLIWIGIFSIGVIFARSSFDKAPKATKQLVDYVSRQRVKLDIELPTLRSMKIGDLVYLADSDQVSPIGAVTWIYGSRTDAMEASGLVENAKRVLGLKSDSVDERVIVYLADRAEITFFGTAPQITEGDHLEYHSAPDSTAWVLKTMLHEEKREELSDLIMDAFRKNQADIVDALKPVVKASLSDASSVIKDDIQKAFERRKDQLSELGDHYQTELVEKELIPLVKDEIWPIVEEESRPLASKMGQEIWNQVSVFRFGWRYLYDKTPLPEKKLTEKEFRRFVDEKAIPILESHMGDVVEVQKTILQKVSENEKVRTKLSDSAKAIARDPKVQQLLSDVLQEVFIDNDRLQGVLRDNWTSPEARKAMQLANDRLEPTITEIGVSLFGSPKEQITPEFAKVLRHRILHKDSRWFMLVKGDSTSDDDGNSRNGVPTPKTLPVSIVNAHSEIPYAPARDRN